jgi:hypothetical protein
VKRHRRRITDCALYRCCGGPRNPDDRRKRAGHRKGCEARGEAVECRVCGGAVAGPEDGRCLDVFCREHYRWNRKELKLPVTPDGSGWGPAFLGTRSARIVNGAGGTVRQMVYSWDPLPDEIPGPNPWGLSR